MSITTVKIRGVKRFRYEFSRIVDGQRHRFTKVLPLGTDQKEADRYDARETARRYAIASGDAPKQSITIAQCVLYYQEDRKDLPHSQIREMATVADPKRNGFGELPIEAIGGWSSKYHSTTKANGTPLAAATIRNRLAYVAAAINHCREKRQIGVKENWAALIQYPPVNNIRTTTVDYSYDLPALLGACDHKEVRDPDEMRALIMFCLYTGMRWISEVLHLKIKGTTLLVEDTKNGKPHSMPIHPALIPWLGYLPFDSMHPREYFRQWQCVRKAAGLNEVTMHDLRRSFASYLVSNGVDPKMVMQAMNQSAAAAARYQWMSTAAKQTAVLALP